MDPVLSLAGSEAAAASEVLYFRTNDGLQVSTARASEPANWICVSCQAGCVVGCPFCATTGRGFFRNLTGEEIASEIVTSAGRFQSALLDRIHFGGIGEPLMNLGEIDRARALIETTRPSLAADTLWDVTTSACLPGRLGGLLDRPWWHTISISLHAARQAVRDVLVPHSRPLAELTECLRHADPAEQSRRLVFNYLLLQGINDDEDDLDSLVRFLRPFSPRYVLLMRVADVGRGYRTDEARLERFAAVLEGVGVPVSYASPARHQRLGGCGTLKVESRRTGRAREPRRPAEGAPALRPAPAGQAGLTP